MLIEWSIDLERKATGMVVAVARDVTAFDWLSVSGWLRTVWLPCGLSVSARTQIYCMIGLSMLTEEWVFAMRPGSFLL